MEQQIPMALEIQGSPRLSILESAVVAPSPPVPETTSLPLTFFDVFWLNANPVERVFLYRFTSGTDTTAIISRLKTSLSQALRAFYPLAGRIRPTADGHELYYQPGDGVTFTVAEYDADIDHLAADEPKELADVLPLVPPLPDGGVVLALQATVLRRGRGIAICMALHHAACDGASSTRFLHTWAAACTAAEAPPPPIITRSLVMMKDPSGGRFLRSVATTGEMEYVKMASDKLLATFTLSNEDIQRIKDVVTGAGETPLPRPCSSLVATFSFIWSCYQRAQDDDDKAATKGCGDGETYFLLPVDHRSRMRPPVPEEYLGNCVGAAMHGAPKDRLAAAGVVGLLAACTAVATAIEQVVGSGGIGSPEQWMQGIRDAAVSGGGVLSVAGSPRFRVYDVDFGFGRPAKVEIVSVARTGAMAVAESRRSSTGGIEVGISLPRAGMRRFQNCFHDAIMWLHHC